MCNTWSSSPAGLPLRLRGERTAVYCAIITFSVAPHSVLVHVAVASEAAIGKLRKCGAQTREARIVREMFHIMAYDVSGTLLCTNDALQNRRYSILNRALNVTVAALVDTFVSIFPSFCRKQYRHAHFPLGIET